MKPDERGGFDLGRTYVQLHDGPGAVALAAGPNFWAEIESRTDLHDGRLVCVFRFTEDWTNWEMHPEGDEIVYVLSGAISVVLEADGAERVIELHGRSACIVPRGVWHTARVHAPSDVLHITRGRGTRHRPLSR